MRQMFVECASRAIARRRAPWACAIARAEGGYWCFERAADYHVWRGQR